MNSRGVPFWSSRAFDSQFKFADMWLGVALALCGAALGGITIWRNLYVDIYQIFMPDLLYYACGYGWVHPPEIPRPVTDFLFSRVLSFDCSSLKAPDPALPAGIFVRVQPYLAWCAGILWRASSPEYRNLWPLAAALVGGYVGGCFLLTRLFFSRWFAVVGTFILMLSPIGLSMVVSIRDYSKAPFFIWSFVLLILAVRTRVGGLSIILAALSGTIIGLGYGFRSDAIIMAPIGLIFLVLMWPRHGSLTRGMAIVSFVLGVWLAAPPILTIGNSGGFGSLVMQGLSEPYQRYLDLGQAPYSFGSRYSDELTLSAIAADLSVDDPDWAKNEGKPGESMTRAVLKSGPYVLSWLPSFAGDMATQSLKSALWILGMPALVSPARIAEAWGVAIAGRPPAALKLAFFYDAIGRSWLPWVGLAGICIFLCQVSAIRPREGLALTAVFGVMLGYTVVQFAIRHIFHLEFLWIFAVLALLRCPGLLADMKRVALRFSGVFAALVCIVVVVRFTLIEYQESSLRQQFDALLALPRQVVVAEATSLGDTITLFRVPVPEKYRGLVTGPADSMDNTMGERGTQWQTIASADRLLLTVGGQNCPEGRVTLTAHYAKRPTVWQPLDHDITIDVDGSSEINVLLPAIYRATQYFDGISMAAANARCLSKIEHINGVTRLLVVLSAVFLPNWWMQQLHRGFGGFPVGKIEPAGIFKPH